MADQAHDLRRMVREGLGSAGPRTQRPKLVLFTSGKGGVGTTTLAISTAAVAAQRGHRTVLVDGNPRGGDVAIFCQVTERWTLAEVLAGQCALDAALQLGPSGLLVLPGAWGQDVSERLSAMAQQRLLDQLRGLQPMPEYVVLDTGCGSERELRRFWEAADVVVAVTSPEMASVMDTYATIKLRMPTDEVPTLLSLVNQAPSAAAAADVHERLDRACRRFLALGLQPAGAVGSHAEAIACARRGDPLALTTGRFGREIGRAAEAVLRAADQHSAAPQRQVWTTPRQRLPA